MVGSATAHVQLLGRHSRDLHLAVSRDPRKRSSQTRSRLRRAVHDDHRTVYLRDPREHLLHRRGDLRQNLSEEIAKCKTSATWFLVLHLLNRASWPMGLLLLGRSGKNRSLTRLVLLPAPKSIDPAAQTAYILDMTVNLTPALEHDLEQLAIECNSTPTALAQQAVEEYVQHMKQLTAEVHEGEESAEREGWIPHEEVFDQLRKRLRKTA